MTLTFLILTVLQDSLPLFLSILPLAVGIGPAALLLVLVVPRLVERQYVCFQHLSILNVRLICFLCSPT